MPSKAKKPAAKPAAKSAKPAAKSAKPASNNAANHAAKPASKRSKPEHEGPLISRAENAEEILEIKQKRDALIARDPNNSKWVESAHMACMGLFRCYKSGERLQCLKEIHQKLDKLAASKK